MLTVRDVREPVLVGFLPCAQPVVEHHPGAPEREMREFNGQANHVHPLVNFPPKVALSRLVNSLKGVSSQRTRQEFPELARHYYRTDKLWPGSYIANRPAAHPR